MAQVESKNRATSDPKARAAVLEEIEARGIEDMLLWFTDLEGHLKSFSITKSEVAGALDDGMGFDGSSITGFNAIEESDMIAMPDPSTFAVLPWRPTEQGTARMFCESAGNSQLDLTRPPKHRRGYVVKWRGSARSSRVRLN